MLRCLVFAGGVFLFSPSCCGCCAAFLTAAAPCCCFLFCLFISSSGGWGKIKLELTTLPRIFFHVVCQINSTVFAIQRSLAYPLVPAVTTARAVPAGDHRHSCCYRFFIGSCRWCWPCWWRRFSTPSGKPCRRRCCCCCCGGGCASLFTYTQRLTLRAVLLVAYPESTKDAEKISNPV